MKTYTITAPNPLTVPLCRPEIIRGTTKAMKQFRAAIKDSVRTCKVRFKRCGVVREQYETGDTFPRIIRVATIRIGGRQGYHIWERIILEEK